MGVAIVGAVSVLGGGLAVGAPADVRMPQASGVSDSGVAQTAVELDLPQQSLAKSLRAVATKFRISLIFDSRTASGRQALALKGRFTVDQAIEQLLVGSDIVLHHVDADTVVLKVKRPRITRATTGNTKAAWCVAAAAMVSCAHASPAVAAQEEKGSAQVEEIVVTAQRREERLQDVPIAVSALTSRDLEMRGITGLSGLATGQIPSFNTLEFAGRPGMMQMSIRGVGGSGAGQVSFEQPVAVYIDDVYMARSQGLGFDLFEPERIEVLRGPQGTLFGRNAVGGAVNLVSKKPRGEFRFRQNVDYGRFDSWRAHTTVEAPEWNTLALKFDYARRETDGWTSNPASGQESFGLMEQRGWRVAARWQPTDVLTADYVYDGTELDSTQTYNHLVINSSLPAFQGIMAPYVHDARQRNVPAPGLWLSPSNYELSGHAVTLNWLVSDNLSLKSVTAYRENDSISKSASGFGVLAPQPPIGFRGGQVGMELAAQEQVSQEFQLSGSADRLEYTIGALYFEEEIDSSVWNLFTHVVPSTTGVPSLLATPMETPRTSTSVDTKSVGVYGQVTWTPPVLEDRLNITAGLRYSKDDKDLLRTELNGVAVSMPVEANEERVDPALTVAYDVMEDVSVYARWATAYRGGGVSVRELPDSRDPNDSGFNPFGPEEVEAFELGLKSELLERSLRLNASAFLQNYDGKQLVFQKDTSSNTRVFNLDDRVKIKGAEIETTWVATRSLKLSLSGTWLEDNVSDAINPSTGLRESWRLAQIPKFRWAGSVDYLFPVNPLAGDLNLFVSLTGSTSYCFNEQSCSGRFEQIRGGRGKSGGEDNNLLEARLALSNIELGGGRIDVALWGKNLLDRSSYQTGFSVPGLNTGIVNYGEPRTYGVSATYEFGLSRAK